MEKRDDINGNIDVIMSQEAEDGRDGVERDEVRVELRSAGEYLELLELVVEVELGVGELVRVVGVLEPGLQVRAQPPLEGEHQLLQRFQVERLHHLLRPLHRLKEGEVDVGDATVTRGGGVWGAV